MRFENELERTPEIREYDRSRRSVMGAIATMLIIVAVVVWLLSSKFNLYFWSSDASVKVAYRWGLGTPLLAIALAVTVFLVVWYTPWFRPVRRKALLSKRNRVQRKIDKQRTKDEERQHQF